MSYRDSGSAYYDSGSTHQDLQAPGSFSAGGSTNPADPNEVVYLISGSYRTSDNRTLAWSLVLGVKKTTSDLTLIIVTFPASPLRSQISFPYRLANPMRWLDLPVGEAASQLTDDGHYSVTLHRLDAAVWRFDFASMPGGEQRAGYLRLVADAPRPPWSTFSYTADISNSGTDTPPERDFASFRLTPCPTTRSC